MAYSQGYAACYSGIGLNENPWTKGGNDWFSWHNGWLAAYRAIYMKGNVAYGNVQSNS